jgi:hypothetical protein
MGPIEECRRSQMLELLSAGIRPVAGGADDVLAFLMASFSG